MTIRGRTRTKSKAATKAKGSGATPASCGRWRTRCGAAWTPPCTSMRFSASSSSGTSPTPSRRPANRLTAQWREQQAEARRLDAAIEANLKSLGFWDQG